MMLFDIPPCIRLQRNFILSPGSLQQTLILKTQDLSDPHNDQESLWQFQGCFPEGLTRLSPSSSQEGMSTCQGLQLLDPNLTAPFGWGEGKKEEPAGEGARLCLFPITK